MSTIVISLLVVGGAVAVVLWITAGEMAQPATQDDAPTGRATDEPATSELETDDDTDEGTHVDEPSEADDPDDASSPVAPPAAVAVAPVAAPAAAPDATGPVEGTVPQAVPSRPAETATVGHTRRPRRRQPVAIPGSYSFDSPPPITWARRLRSALGVVLVVTAVGLALAASVGVLVVFVSRALEGAVN